MDITEETPLAAGMVLARGVTRHFAQNRIVSLTEFVPARGLRVDVISMNEKGEIWIVECKSCRADFQADHKWQGYLEWCDRFFWAVDTDFPLELLPAETGILRADGYSAAVLREAPLQRLASARRKALSLKFARTAAARLSRLADPGLHMPEI